MGGQFNGIYIEQGALGQVVADSGYLYFGSDKDLTLDYDADNSKLLLTALVDGIYAWEIGNGTADIDFKIFLGTAGTHVNFDVGNTGVELTLARLDFKSPKDSADGGLIKAGTSGTKVTTATADMKFLSLYLENTATSGDNRGMYLRLYLGGAGGGGEAARIFTTVNDVAAGTAHGAHISLNFGSTGSITGLGVGVRSTLHIPNQAQVGGTYAGGQSELYFDGASADISGATMHSIHRFICDGDATGMATAGYVFEFVGLSAVQLQASVTEANYAQALKCKVNGTDYYLMLANAAG